MAAGPRFEVFKALGLNYYGFHVRKEKVYNVFAAGISTFLLGFTAYMAVTFVCNWRSTILFVRYHNAKLELEREGYIKQISEARDKGLLPPRETPK
ncbi:hypothetical protein BEWA_037310 [Theileria equi strain WA]|uniref:Cytochrome c oxidase assembly protein COX14 n=1 Tax=Theileria equi strain WA TaxID=1537102 RepID=L1LEL4_THEEQ|nr:hypothetical protein BEWA_037310 [Theileria equi strain WA]EKX73695.1 hypothetical protein BEWA_037310 [Theileria equi strain WA]|eukprot:XP_004833147.1 hypothetical protein BEWA_037310 [Theileria equi strain WA]